MLPQTFLDRLAQVVPPERVDAVVASFALDKPPALWLNPLRATPEATLAELVRAFPPESGARFEPLLPGAVIARDVPHGALAGTPAVSEGRAYLINPSSLIPPLVLAPEPDDAVLDLCAAPGGKTLQLAARIAAHPGTGHLAAVEAVRPRFFKLQGILDRYGALARPGVRLFMKDGRHVGGAVPERFDKILVDAPCSSEARFDSDDAASFAHWSPRKIAECAYKQRGLLDSALAALKVGGTLVYCTCSFSPEENEQTVLAALAAHEGRVVAVPSELPRQATGEIPAVPGLLGLDAAWRILPDALWDGFFLVRLHKLASTAREEPKRAHRQRRR